MFIPFEKLPKLLRHPLQLPNISRLCIKYTTQKIEENEIRLWFKSQGPRLKYYNPHMTVQHLQLKEEIQPQIEVWKDEQMISTIANTKEVEAKLKEIDESLGS